MSAGRLVLMGSGEIAPTMVATHRNGMTRAGVDEVVVLDTPFGFQENADELTERIADYFRISLSAAVSVASLRSVSSEPLEVERALLAVKNGRYVFAGPGSPSYALKVWKRFGLAESLRAVIADGGTVTLASAAALTAGLVTLPVYEVYKVGEDPFWLEGMDLTSAFGMALVAVPHWNNAEGGTHDTSRCYVGERRLSALEAQLDVGVLGIDEHTAVTLDFGEGTLAVTGASTATLRGTETIVLESGDQIDIAKAAEVLASARPVDPVDGGQIPTGFNEALEARDVDAALAAMLAAEDGDRNALRSMMVALGEAARSGLVDPRQVIGGYVDLLLELRRSARSDRRFEESDLIRGRLAELGVEVRDTADGVEWDLR
jgi:cyanophycinase-like exopeptidase